MPSQISIFSEISQKAMGFLFENRNLSVIPIPTKKFIVTFSIIVFSFIHIIKIYNVEYENKNKFFHSIT